MRVFPHGIICLVILFLTGCSQTLNDNTSQHQADLALYSIRPPLLKDKYSQPENVSQLVTFHYQDRIDALPFVISFNTDEMLMTAIASWGSPLFVLRYDGHHINYLQRPPMGIELSPQYVLGDFFITYWPKNLLEKQLNPLGYTIEEQGLRRQIKKDGQLVISISFSSGSHWQSIVEFEHHELGYHLHIKPLDESN